MPLTSLCSDVLVVICHMVGDATKFMRVNKNVYSGVAEWRKLLRNAKEIYSHPLFYISFARRWADDELGRYSLVKLKEVSTFLDGPTMWIDRVGFFEMHAVLNVRKRHMLTMRHRSDSYINVQIHDMGHKIIILCFIQTTADFNFSDLICLIEDTNVIRYTKRCNAIDLDQKNALSALLSVDFRSVVCNFHGTKTCVLCDKTLKSHSSAYELPMGRHCYRKYQTGRRALIFAERCRDDAYKSMWN